MYDRHKFSDIFNVRGTREHVDAEYRAWTIQHRVFSLNPLPPRKTIPCYRDCYIFFCIPHKFPGAESVLEIRNVIDET